MAHPLADLSILDQFADAAFPPDQPEWCRLFYSPVDRIHAALVYLLGCVTRSAVLAQFGFDDPDLAAALKTLLEDPGVYVQVSLDDGQAAGPHEAALLAAENYPLSSVAVGPSEKGAYMHLKELVIDGSVYVTGSTNWSGSGEADQDNALLVVLDSALAGQATARMGAIHASMLARTKGSP